MFTCLRSDQWVLIILAPRDGKAYYMDFMKVKKKFKTKCVSAVLDNALQVYAEQGGLVAQKPKEEIGRASCRERV